jgi:hypothetical protein
MPDDKTTQALIGEIKLLRQAILTLAAAQLRAPSVNRDLDAKAATEAVEALWKQWPFRAGGELIR